LSYLYLHTKVNTNVREVGLAWGASPVPSNRLLNTGHILGSSTNVIKREKIRF